jgi:hypothetical protein
MAKASNVVHLHVLPSGGGAVADTSANNGLFVDAVTRARVVIDFAATAQRELDQSHSRQRERLSAKGWWDGLVAVSGDTRESVDRLREELLWHPKLFPTTSAYIHSTGRMIVDRAWFGPNTDGFVPVVPDASHALLVAELSRVNASPYTALALMVADLAKSHPEAFGKLASLDAHAKVVDGLRRNLVAAVTEVARLPPELLTGIAHVSGLPVDPIASLPQRLVEHATAGWPKAVAVETGTRHFTAGAGFLNQ